MDQTMTPDTPPAPEKGVADILVEAFKLYRANAKPLLGICALLFVPSTRWSVYVDLATCLGLVSVGAAVLWA